MLAQHSAHIFRNAAKIHSRSHQQDFNVTRLFKNGPQITA
ncbi:MAG: hypothetical protein GAK38_04182 [Xylophilus sp.]|nr:MAG: hypothetical protein GAK38_04182 [Xylophilus sp.]